MYKYEMCVFGTRVYDFISLLKRSEFFDHLHLLYEHGNTNLNLNMALTLARIQQDVLEFAEFYVSKVS